MTETKPILASRTVWGALVAILATLAGLAVSPDDQARAMGLFDQALDVWDRLLALAGAALALWGRLRATTRVTGAPTPRT